MGELPLLSAVGCAVLTVATATHAAELLKLGSSKLRRAVHVRHRMDS
jgi:hypothetical protein